LQGLAQNIYSDISHISPQILEVQKVRNLPQFLITVALMLPYLQNGVTLSKI